MAARTAVAEGLTEDQFAGRIDLPAYAHWDEYDSWMVLNARAVYRWVAGGER